MKDELAKYLCKKKHFMIEESGIWNLELARNVADVSSNRMKCKSMNNGAEK